MLTYCVLKAFDVSYSYAAIFRKSGSNLDKKSMRDHFDNLYLDINLKRSSQTKYYYIIFMLRRMLFAAIPIVLYMYVLP